MICNKFVIVKKAPIITPSHSISGLLTVTKITPIIRILAIEKEKNPHLLIIKLTNGLSSIPPLSILFLQIYDDIYRISDHI